MIRHRRVHGGHTSDVDDDDAGAIGANAAQELLGELSGTMRVNDADDRENEQALPHLQHRRRQLANRFLLLADDALAFLHEPDSDGVGDPIGRRFVGVEHAIQLVRIVLILAEQRPGEHVTQEQHDADDLVGFDPPAG